MSTPESPESPPRPPEPKPIAHIEFKAMLLLVLMTAVVLGSVAYVLFARGVFAETQPLVLVADDSEGVVVGMDLTFSGFPIGRVRRIALGDDGKARVQIDVATEDARWLRSSSVFTMERGVVGDTKLRAFTGVLTDPPLPAGAERPVLRGDAAAEIPRLLAAIQTLVENVSRITQADSALNATLDNTRTLTGKLGAPGGALGVLLGSDANAAKAIAALDRTNALLARTESIIGKADQRLFGPRGVADDAQASLAQLTGLLADARASLKKVDAVLVEAQAIGANARVASTDLGALRAEVEASLRKVDALVLEVNRTWPFARETEIKLP
jgi:phospholipid/cholesterol/gamma-HCH transport system substrate-binding protein